MHGSTHEPGQVDALTGYLPTTSRGAASGVGSLTTAQRQPTSEAPLVSNPIRLGNVSSTVTSDASSSAGNLINLNVNGDITIVAPINPTDHQVLEHHCVAVGADRQVTFTGTAYVLGGAPTLGPYLIPRGKVLVARSVYIGNRATAADAASPAWALVSAAITDAVPIQVRATAAKTANYTLTGSDDVIIMNTTSGALTATLPTAVGRAGQGFWIKKLGPNPLTINTTGGQSIDGVTSETISMAYGFRQVISDGTSWHIIGGKIEPVVLTLADVAGNGTISLNASAATLYRVRGTGSPITFAAPGNPIDADVVNAEIYNSSGSSLVINIAAAIFETGGLPAAYTVPAGKALFLALRYRATTSPATLTAGWRLLAATIEN